MNITQKPLKVGVFIARFQPLHKAHIYVIEKALKEYIYFSVEGTNHKAEKNMNIYNPDEAKSATNFKQKTHSQIL